PVVASLEVFREAGMAALHDKSVQLTGYLDALLRARLANRVETITPAGARGCQLSLRLLTGEPKTVLRGLEARNVFVDWREPDVIRAAPVPLYNGFVDVFEFVARLAAALEDG